MSRSRTNELAALLAADNTDAAIEAGLMAWQPAPGDAAAEMAAIVAARARLASAWAARERYRNRAVRLRRIAAERDARRAPPPAAAGAPAPLPSSVAAILARAKARAAQAGK